MKTLTAKRSGALICGALLSTIVTVAEPAQANPTLLNYTGVWGNTAGGVYSTWTGTHTYGGAPTVLAASPLPNYTITLTSGPSNRPGWTYELTVDFAAAGLIANAFPVFDTTLVIKPPGTPNPITGYQVKNGAGTILNTTDLGSTAGTLRFRNLIADFNLAGTANDKMIIQWNQAVPGPGSLALLGLAGLAGTRRRRS